MQQYVAYGGRVVDRIDLLDGRNFTLSAACTFLILVILRDIGVFVNVSFVQKCIVGMK